MFAIVRLEPSICARQTKRLFTGHSPEAHRQGAGQSLVPAESFGAQEGSDFVVVAAYA